METHSILFLTPGSKVWGVICVKMHVATEHASMHDAYDIMQYEHAIMHGAYDIMQYEHASMHGAYDIMQYEDASMHGAYDINDHAI